MRYQSTRGGAPELGFEDVLLTGLARDGGDVYEFAQRLKLSQYFDQVTLLPGKQEAQRDDEIDLVKFALQVKVRY